MLVLYFSVVFGGKCLVLRSAKIERRRIVITFYFQLFCDVVKLLMFPGARCSQRAYGKQE